MCIMDDPIELIAFPEHSLVTLPNECMCEGCCMCVRWVSVCVQCVGVCVCVCGAWVGVDGPVGAAMGSIVLSVDSLGRV